MPFTEDWWNAPIFFPMRGALALSEHLFGISIFSTPILLAGGSPPLGYNVALVLACAMSAFFAYLLVLRLTGSRPAGLCAAVAYGFAPYRAGQLAHLQVLSSQWLPLMLLALHAYLDGGRARWLGVFASAWILQALSNGYFLIFTPVLIGLWLAWFGRESRRWRRVAAILGVWAAASLPLLPVLLKYHEIHRSLGLVRSPQEIEMFSATPSSVLSPQHLLRFWSAPGPPSQEADLFPGLTIVAIVVAALVRSWRSRVLLFYALAALLMYALALGPGGEHWSRWIRPYAWLEMLPGVDALRVPARFGMLMAFCLAIAAGLAYARLQPVNARPRAAMAVLVFTGLFIDTWIEPLPLIPPPGRVILPDIPRAAVFELPPDDTFVGVNAMYRSLSHERPLVNGYSGHWPPHYRILQDSLLRDDPSGLLELSRGRPLILILQDRNDPDGVYREVMESLPGIQRFGTSGAGTVYVLPARATERRPQGGEPLPFTTTFQPREHVVVDLGSPKTVRTVEFALRWHYEDLGSRFAVEASQDGQTWTSVWEDWTAGPAVAAALEDQVIVPVRLPIADVQARYLRLHPAPAWLMRELRIVGP
jgi:hypothetical protein